MAEINLLCALPKSRRNIKAREFAKTDKHVQISREFASTRNSDSI